ncbi:MAG: acyl-CoA dehydrogenase, partial [Saccharothrix sp.]|nr:acyl-CoA dehydrogenase [Saccharothrix sp.]
MSAELPEHLRVLEAHCIEIAGQLRAPGLVLDEDPDAITRYLDLPAVRLQEAMLIPPRFAGETYRVGGHSFPGGSCLSRVVVMDRLAYGDPGVLLAAPGPSLAGAAVQALGSERQQSRFFARFAEQPTWTFFALTEHGKGSAAAELETRLVPTGDGFALHGTKKYIGTGARAQTGVVFCRRAPGPMGIEAVLVDTPAPGFHGELLPILGLRGVRISELVFDGLVVDPDMVLGHDRRPSRRGFLGARETLSTYRPSLAAMSLGVADAVLDYARAERTVLSTADAQRVGDLAGRVAVTRRRVREVAAALDAGRPDRHGTSAVKLTATRLAEEATLLAVDLLGPTALLEHPWLDKTYRDVRAFEFMEGAGDIHRLMVFQGALR